MVVYHYWLGPPRLVADEMGPCWCAPPECVGWIDLNHLAGQGQVTDRALRKAGLFWTPAGVALPGDEFDRLNSVAAYISDVSANGAILDAWQGNLGYRPPVPAGASLLNLLWEGLTTYATVAEDDDRCMPLMPTVRGTLDLHLAGHSLVRRERFDIRKHRHAPRVLEVIHRQYERVAGDEQRGRARAGQALRVLDYARAKYRLGSRDDERESAPWRVLLPARERGRVRRLLPHETVHTESFDQPDSTTLGPDLPWVEFVGSWETISGTAASLSGSNPRVAFPDLDLSSIDHLFETVLTAQTGAGGSQHQQGCIARKLGGSADQTYYHVDCSQVTTWRTFKRITGTFTNLGVDTSAFMIAGDVLRVECDGSSIRRIVTGNAAHQATATDTSISSGLRGGLETNNILSRFDDVVMADLAVPTAIQQMLLMHG